MAGFFSSTASSSEIKFATFTSTNPIYGTELTIDGVQYEIYDGTVNIVEEGRKVTFRFNVKMGEKYSKKRVSQLQITHHF